MPQTVLLTGLVALLSGAAALLIDRREPWPDDLPPRAYYERLWEADAAHQRLQSRDRYLARVLHFYSTWTPRRAELLAPLDPDQVRLTEPELDLLGQVIASEWSRPDAIRRIPPQTLALWGQALLEARDVDRLEPVVDQLRDDVRALVQGSLDPATLTAARYAATALTKTIAR